MPIYKKAFELAVYIEQVVVGFSRYHKYTLGTSLRNRSREIVLAIIRANSSRDKVGHLLSLRGELEELLLLIRLAKEAKAFKSFNAFAYVAGEAASISRQNEGWLKACVSSQARQTRDARIKCRQGTMRSGNRPQRREPGPLNWLVQPFSFSIPLPYG